MVRAMDVMARTLRATPSGRSSCRHLCRRFAPAIKHLQRTALRAADEERPVIRTRHSTWERAMVFCDG